MRVDPELGWRGEGSRKLRAEVRWEGEVIVVALFVGVSDSDGGALPLLYKALTHVSLHLS